MSSATMEKATQDALSMLKQEHDKVKKLFDQFEEGRGDKKKIVKEALRDLKIHAFVEENLFYPALRQELEEQEILEEADEEHHVAKLLIAELENMTGKEDHFDAKFIVLAENIRHHIKEEEGEIFPEARRTNVDFKALGEQMMALKAQLQSDGVPQEAEAKMIARFGLRGDSPAKNAEKTVEVPKKTAKSSR